MEKQELWKPVAGYEGLYEVSDMGRVRSMYFAKERMLALCKNSNSYLQVKLYKQGKPKTHKVHKLVWEAFNGRMPEDMEIDHINTVREDNRLENLRCVTPKENVNNPLSKLKQIRGLASRAKETISRISEAAAKHNIDSYSKPVLQYDLAGNLIKEWTSLSEAARQLGLNVSNISRNCHQRRPTAYGYIWKLKEVA